MLLASVAFASGEAIAQGPGLTTQTWPAGTYLSTLNRGGRITTFHRGWLYLGAIADTSVWDISDPTNPVRVQLLSGQGVNGHAWNKVSDLFWRQYWIPEHGDSSPPQFQDLLDPINRVPWIASFDNFPVMTSEWNFLGTYPLGLGSTVRDVRTGQVLANMNLEALDGINASQRWRLGNLLFFTPGDEQTGVSVWDVGDPTQPVLLDVLSGNIRQYTTAWQIWRNYIVLLVGDNQNGPDGDANLLAIDISDPTDLQVAFTLPLSVAPGRYMHFQDQYGFTGRGQTATKVNMETGQVVLNFSPPSGGAFEDFQWIPYGHLLMMSQAQTNSSHSYLFTHQDGLDTTPPYVGYHLPVDGAVNQPLSTVVGLVINETLDDTTIDDSTFEVSPIGGQPIAGTVVSSQYDVINFVPLEPLQPDTTYRVELVEDGIRDVAGNGIDQTIFRFSTGNTIDPGNCTWPDVDSVGGIQTGEVTFGACLELQVESGFEATHGAVVDLVAGERIGFEPGVSVASGAVLRAHIDPGLRP